MIRAIIIDDEPLAHQVIEHHLQEHPDIKLVAQFYSAKDALCALAKSSVDMVFLDINMPEVTGLELIKALAKTPQIVIVSAYHEYAITGFELNVTDYLLKPVSAPRLDQALNKVRDRLPKYSPTNANYITLKVDREKRKFDLNSVEYIEAYGNYVKLHQAQQVTLATATLKQLSEQLSHSFTQIHKSLLVNNQNVISISHDHVELNTGTTLKIGKSFKEIAQTLL